MSERPIRDYALIGNCETAALVNRDGGIDWLCLPAFDGGSIFGALLDREKGGNFSLHPNESYEVERSYREESAVLETRFVTARGAVVLNDFFVIARTAKARFYDFTSLQPTRKLVRTFRLEGTGPVAMQMRVQVRPDYARRAPAWAKMAGGFGLAEAALFTSLPVRLERDDLCAQFELRPNERHFVVLDYSDERTEPDLAQITRWQEITEAFWREWNLFNYYRGPHQSVVRRSAVTLKLLTYAPSGAFVAAPTTSLPEVPGGENNWDYRYTWLRDTGLLIDTLFRLGYSGEAKAFLNFVVRQGSGGKGQEDDPLRLMYAIRGGDVPEESTLDHLGGYGGARPVRIGNRARGQLQLDTFAHVLEAFFYYQHTGGKLDRAMRRVVERSIETLLERWAEPDNGVWETVERRPYTYGKVMAWAGFAAAAKLSKGREKSLGKVCARIRDEVLQKGVRTEDGRRFLAAEYYGEGAIDAASLLAFTSGFLEPELGRSTREQIEEKLGAGDLLYRNEEQRENGEGGFLLCSFWLINHLLKEGAIDRAEKILEKLLARMSPLGLFSEEIDPQTGEFLGNFPQAFSHLGLIGTILNLDLAKRKPALAGLSDHEKFERTVGPTVGLRGVLAGFFRVPKTLVLIFRSRSKWR